MPENSTKGKERERMNSERILISRFGMRCDTCKLPLGEDRGCHYPECNDPCPPDVPTEDLATYEQLKCNVQSLATELDIQRQRAIKAESELSTFKAKAEAADFGAKLERERANKMEERADDLQNCIDARARVMEASDTHWQTATSKINHLWKNGFFPGIEGLCQKLLETIVERDTLKARCEKLGGYAVHKKDCDSNITSFHPYVPICTCGLDELRKQGEGKYGEIHQCNKPARA